MTRIMTLFTAHPESVNESFGAHFLFALRFAGLLFAAGGAALVHALLPFLFQTTASRIVARLHERTHNRGARPDDGAEDAAQAAFARSMARR